MVESIAKKVESFIQDWLNRYSHANALATRLRSGRSILTTTTYCLIGAISPNISARTMTMHKQLPTRVALPEA